jgi:hypothetical protein
MTNAENLNRFRTMMLDKEVGAIKARVQADHDRRMAELMAPCRQALDSVHAGTIAAIRAGLHAPKGADPDAR